MSVTPPSSASPHRRIPTAARILALLALSALLHMLAIEWAGDGLRLPAWRSREAPTVQVELKPAPLLQPPPQPPAAAPMPQPPPKPRPKPKKPAAPRPVTPEPAAPEPPASATPTMPTPDASLPPSAAAAVDPVPAAPAPEAATAATEASAAPAAPETPRYTFRMPPSVELKYDVEALREGKTVYGKGKIAWRSGIGNYEVRGEAGVLFFTLLEFGSRGLVDENGVSPVLYSEKRFRKSETHTHFRREDGLISFSASTISYPRHGGEQDRASIVWQLAAIGLGDPGRYQSGAQLEFFVAGVRDGETWTMQVLGLEDIDTASGHVKAWHVVRVPRPGSYEQKLDIWLAPERNWYPLRLRWTETSGEFLDMSASAVTPLESPTPLK
jgi:hypothetical protein